jgi:hypothetical protein
MRAPPGVPPNSAACRRPCQIVRPAWSPAPCRRVQTGEVRRIHVARVEEILRFPEGEEEVDFRGEVGSERIPKRSGENKWKEWKNWSGDELVSWDGYGNSGNRHLTADGLRIACVGSYWLRERVPSKTAGTGICAFDRMVRNEFMTGEIGLESGGCEAFPFETCSTPNATGRSALKVFLGFGEWSFLVKASSLHRLPRDRFRSCRFVAWAASSSSAVTLPSSFRSYRARNDSIRWITRSS